MTTVSITIDMDRFNNWKSNVIEDAHNSEYNQWLILEKARTGVSENEKKSFNNDFDYCYWIKVVEGTKGFLLGLTEKTCGVSDIMADLISMDIALREMEKNEKQYRNEYARLKNPKNAEKKKECRLKIDLPKPVFDDDRD